MNVLKKLTKKSLKLNKKRTIVTIIGVILAVSLITAVSSLFFSARSSLIAFEIREKGNYHYAFKDVLESDLTKFENNRHLERIYLTKEIGYAHIPSKNEYKPYAYVMAFDDAAIKNLGIELIDGRLPKDSSEIVISEHVIANGKVKLNVGDVINLEVGPRVSDNIRLTQDNPYNTDNEEIIVGTTTKTYKIVGIVGRLAREIEPYTAPGYTFITYLDNKDAGMFNVYTRLVDKKLDKTYEVVANILGVSPEAFKKVYNDDNPLEEDYANLSKAKYQFDCNGYLLMLEGNLFGESTTASLGVIVLIVCGIIVFTSIFCIKNSFDISTSEKIKEYGMLRSIGATKRQIRLSVYYEAFLIALIGIPLGIICGLLASYILIIVSNFFLKGLLNNLGLIFTFSYLSIIFSIVLGTITIFVAALRSALKASKLPPIVSLKNAEAIKIKAKNLKTPRYITKLFGIGGEIAYKNIKRNKKKYRVAVITIVVGVMTFIALSYFMNLGFKSLKMEYKTTEYNLAVNYDKKENLGLYEEVYSLKEDKSINNLIMVSRGTLLISNCLYSKEYLEIYPELKTKEEKEDWLNIKAIDDKNFREYVKMLGLDYETTKNQGILLNNIVEWQYNEKKKRSYQVNIPQFNYNAMDTLHLKEDNNDIETIEITIAKVTDKYPFALENNSVRASLIVSEEWFNNNLREEYSYIYIKAVDAKNLQNRLDNLLTDYTYRIENVNDNVKMMESFYTLVGIFLYGFIIVISLIGITSIFNTITTSMQLRQKEFATLKCVGMTRKEFIRMLYLESFFYCFKSLIIGIPVGVGLSYLLYIVLMDGDKYISYQLPYLAILIATLTVFLLINIIMSYSYKLLDKQNIIEVIRKDNI